MMWRRAGKRVLSQRVTRAHSAQQVSRSFDVEPRGHAFGPRSLWRCVSSLQTQSSRLQRRSCSSLSATQARFQRALTELETRPNFVTTPPPPDYTWRGRAAQQNIVEASVVNNFVNRRSNNRAHHHFLMAPGHVRVGKTRLGFEVPRVAEHCGTLKRQAGLEGKTLTGPVFVFVDFLNGCKFHDVIDGDRAGRGLRMDPLAFRLAQSGLGATRLSAQHEDLSPVLVVEEMVKRALPSPQSLDVVVPVVVHFDEYGKFVEEFGSHVKGVKAFKNMLRSFGSIMTGAAEQQDMAFRDRYFMVPVVTGTSLADADLRPTGYTVVEINLSPLTPKDARQLATEGLRRHVTSQLMTEDEVDMVLNDNNFCIALGDTGGIPGAVDMLVNKPGREECWGVRLKELSQRYSKPDAIPLAARPVVLDKVMAQIPVEREEVLAGSFTVGDLERLGCVLLQPESGSSKRFTMSAPIPLLREWNDDLDASQRRLGRGLLLDPDHDRPWRWQDFEMLHFQMQRAIINALARQGVQEPCVGEVLKGVVSHSDTLRKRVSVQTLSMGMEVAQFMPKGTDTGRVGYQPYSVMRRFGDVEERKVSIWDAALLCQKGNKGVDARFAFQRPSDLGGPPILVWFQYKHSELSGREKTVRVQDLVAWHDEVLGLLAPEFQQHAELLLVLVTNRRLVRGGEEEEALLQERPSLAYLTAEELPHFSPLIAHRGLLALPTEDYSSTPEGSAP